MIQDMSKEKELCFCGSDDSYENCCAPFHRGKIPPNALKLMRSRYSAYALNLADYIIKTTHPASPNYLPNLDHWKQMIEEFSKNTKFQNLQVVDFKEMGNFATVTFIAHIYQKNQNATFTEKSYFEKIKGEWFYRSGHLIRGAAPNFITVEPEHILPLAYFGDPILKQKALPIKEITADLKRLVEEMIDTLFAYDAVGLAAPQVHHSIRLFIIREIIEDKQGIRYGDIKVFINPIISFPSNEKIKLSEGCASIPTIHAEVERYKEISVEYTSLDGQRIKEICSGWKARTILHENDHLDGVLFIDRLDQIEKDKLDPFLKHLYRRIHDGTEL